ncbi:MAG: formylglycine-generating enzyme family protein [Methylococcales bacterium]
MRDLEVFPDVFPEPYAKDWGEDQYGPWVEFDYKGVFQRYRWNEPCTFLMGSPQQEAQRHPDEFQHHVEILKGFWMAETTVTQALWEIVMGNNPSRFKSRQRPVERISWHDVQQFINEINNFSEALSVRLPTEAEWEYACRAGTTTAFSFGECITADMVNFDSNYAYIGAEKGLYRKTTVEVGSLPCNAWGLYEMHGNVLEWCGDCYQEPGPRAVNSQIIEAYRPRILRGGSWFTGGRSARSACRDYFDPTEQFAFLGFRLVCN